jgi:hypothetical protein
MLSILPVSYLILKVWHTVPETVYYVYGAAVVIAHIARMLIIRPMINLSLRKYAKEVLLPMFLVLVFAIIVPIVLAIILPGENIAYSILIMLSCVLCSGLSIWFIGLTRGEKQFAVSKVKSILHKK